MRFCACVCMRCWSALCFSRMRKVALPSSSFFRYATHFWASATVSTTMWLRPGHAVLTATSNFASTAARRSIEDRFHFLSQHIFSAEAAAMGLAPAAGHPNAASAAAAAASAATAGSDRDDLKRAFVDTWQQVQAVFNK